MHRRETIKSARSRHETSSRSVRCTHVPVLPEHSTDRQSLATRPKPGLAAKSLSSAVVPSKGTCLDPEVQSPLSPPCA
jgi:hypothetical protein